MSDGFLYIGIADKAADAERIRDLDEIEPIRFDDVDIVGVEREARILKLSIDRYMRLLEDGIDKSALSEPLKTNLLTSLDLISYKDLQVVRVRVPRQTQLTFLGDECYLRIGSSTQKATGPRSRLHQTLFAEVGGNNYPLLTFTPLPPLPE